jgi:AraC-like DNA-binding protein
MNYRLLNHHISPVTSEFLLDLYELTNKEGEYIYACIPKGELGITIVLSGESYLEYKGEWIKQEVISVYGLIKKRQFFRISSNYREITIGFTPHQFQLLMKESMSSLLKNKCTDLNYLFNKYEVEKLFLSIANSKNDLNIIKGIEYFIMKHLNYDKIDLRLINAYSLISNNMISNVNDLSKRLQISTVWLRNIFNDKIGLSPKDMMKILRIKRALQNKNSDEESLTELAYSLDYYDQSHFIHDFTNVIGMTPKKYFDNKKLTFDFYNFARWRIDSFDETIFTKFQQVGQK